MPEERNGRWYIGNKRYKSKAAAVRSWRAYLWKKKHKKAGD